jgi:HAD superfamily hydrolase (TIGR01450 family)
MIPFMKTTFRLASLVLTACVTQAPAASAQLALEIKDFLVMPMTGSVDSKANNELLLSRVNTLREEAGGARRLFISDLNGPLYILDKETKKFVVYLNFNGTEGKPGLFHKLMTATGYGNGLNGFYLDPDYTRNGKFYTTHIENPALPGSNLPDNAHFPGVNVTGYTTTAAIKTPGPMVDEGVLIEWTDTTPANSTFEGTARELLRVQLNTTSHPLGDLIFNPAARRGDPDWRVLYIECGDGASGESTNTAIRANPQRLDNLEGKILRIIPDLNEHTATSAVSENGRYRIPNDNPFVSTPGARKEIWAYGFRNPHRLNCDLPIFDGLGLDFVPLEQADYVVCTGLRDDEVETPENYRAELGELLRRKMFMLCGNPDLVVERGDRLIYCAGAIADLYGTLGGEVLYAGKPHRPIYELALQRVAGLRGAMPAKRRVLAIGDSVRTDLRGATDFGLDCLFVTAGIHAEELGDRHDPNPAALNKIFADAGVAPKAVTRRLVW